MEQRFRDGWGWGIAGGAIDIQKVNIASELVDSASISNDKFVPLLLHSFV
jgi:hypothetical protein